MVERIAAVTPQCSGETNIWMGDHTALSGHIVASIKFNTLQIHLIK